MIFSQNITEPRPKEAAVALGFFDGVHLGHRAVIEAAVNEARQGGLNPCVFTFDPTSGAPANKGKLTLLQTEQQKIDMLEQMGVQEMICPEFQLFKMLSPKEYVEQLLVHSFHAKVLTCGENYHFGCKAAGNVEMLIELCRPHGVKVIPVPPVLYEGEWISSTRIRQAIRDGEIELANRMLGSRFTVQSRVMHGKRLGRTIEAPTINQLFPENFTVPRYGVYATSLEIDGKTYYGVTNVGVKPTLGEKNLTCETYILDYSGNLYDREIPVSFLKFLRPEQKFDTVEALAARIQYDAQTVREYAQTESAVK